MNKLAIFPGRYLQGAGALDSLPDELKRLEVATPLVVAGQSARSGLIEEVKKNSGKELKYSVEAFGGECSDDEINRLVSVGKKDKSDAVVGMGGGKAMDTAKAVANKLKVPSIIVPTIASTDAPCSALSVVYKKNGSFDRYDFYTHNPSLVLVDSQVIANAPVRYLVAGIGDALATWFEASSCEQNDAANQAGGRATQAAYTIARLCYLSVLEFAVPAIRSCYANVVTPALERVIEANTLLSGIGFESAGLASAHAIHNGLTTLPGTHEYLHGEKVAFGVLAGLFLCDRPRELIDEVYYFCSNVGLPTTLGDIGLRGVSDEDLYKVAKRACRRGETIHKEPLEINPDKVFAAIKLAHRTGIDKK